MSLPVIDIAPLLDGSAPDEVAKALDVACRNYGFFYVVNHGVDASLQNDLVSASRQFFDQDLETKNQISMEKGGRAWRGYFPVGGELTSGLPDIKEGIYFGTELASDHPSVKGGLPLHGPNLFPASPPHLKPLVLSYMDAMTRLSHALMEGLSRALGLMPSYFRDHYTNDPFTLFRIFNYPPPESLPFPKASWGVGEHTDYGVLTILKQDELGGLEVRTPSGWMAAPPIADSFVCNIGDMLDRMTGGTYHSTLHRVQNTSGRARLSFPFFFDPNFHAEVKPLPIVREIREDHETRWDNSSVHSFRGTYGEYLIGKVSKVFPGLAKELPPVR